MNKTSQRCVVNLFSFLPFLFLLITGMIMLMYHAGNPYSLKVLGLDGNDWLFLHKTFTIISLPLIVLHLYQHLDWLKKLFTLSLKNKHKRVNVTLFVVFILCALTSLLSWLIFNDSFIGKALKGMHNKFGMLLIILFVIHIAIYSKSLLKTTKKMLENKKHTIIRIPRK